MENESIKKKIGFVLTCMEIRLEKSKELGNKQNKQIQVSV